MGQNRSFVNGLSRRKSGTTQETPLTGTAASLRVLCRLARIVRLLLTWVKGFPRLLFAKTPFARIMSLKVCTMIAAALRAGPRGNRPICRHDLHSPIFVVSSESAALFVEITASASPGYYEIRKAMADDGSNPVQVSQTKSNPVKVLLCLDFRASEFGQINAEWEG
jgi:hypothetical protein